MDTETYNVGISNHPLINDCEENEHSMLLGQNVRHHHGMVFYISFIQIFNQFLFFQINLTNI